MAVLAPPARPADTASSGPGLRTSLLRLLADPRRLFVAVAALVAFGACVDVLQDPDLWWHLRLGRWILDNHAVPHAEMFTFTAAGNAMTAHEWGSEVVFSLLARAGGVLLVAVVMGLVAWGGLLVLAARARLRGAGPVALACALLLGARAAQPVLGTRPQVFTFALICACLLVAERHLARGTRWIWGLPPAVMVGANLHGGFVLALVALGLLLGFEAVRTGLGRPGAAPWSRLRSLGVVLALCALAACLNAYGPGLYPYALFTSAAVHAEPITEWQPPDFADPGNLGLLLLLVSFAAMLALGGRLTLRDLGMSVIGFAAALAAVRNTSLAVALALPAWASLAQQVGTRWGPGVSALRARRSPAPQVSARWTRRLRGSTPRNSPARRETLTAEAPRRLGAPQWVAAAAIACIGLTVPALTVARAAQQASASGIAGTYPSCAASALRGVRDVRLVAPYFHSGYLADQLWPATHVFIYGEAASLGPAVFTAYQQVYAGGQPALGVLTGQGANTVLTPPGALQAALSATPQWRRVLTDPTGLALYSTLPLPATIC
jgi:hypothetical protein